MADFNTTYELQTAGQGLGALLTSLRVPLMYFLLSMAIVVGIVKLWGAVTGLIKKQFKGG